MKCRKCGKEIITENVTTTERVMNKVTFKDTIKLAIANLVSTPSKFILLLIITLFFTLFLFVGVTTYLYMEKVSYMLTETNTSADDSDYKNRIVVKKSNDEKFTQEEINAFANIRNVSAVVEYDIFFESEMYYAFDEDVDMLYYSSHIQPAKNLTFTDLLYGRLPKNKDEVVLTKAYKYLNKTVYIVAEGEDEPRVCKVVGLLPTSEPDAIYVHDDVLESVCERFEMNKTMLHFKIDPLDKQLGMLGQNYNWYVDNSLKDNEIRVETHTNQTSSKEEPYVRKKYTPVDYFFMDNQISLSFDQKYLIHDKYTYPAVENSNITGKQYIYRLCDKNNVPSTNGYLNQKNYDLLKEFKSQHYQISVLVNNEKNIESVVREIEKGPYYCSSKGLIVNENQTLLATVFEVGVAVIIVVLVFGLSAIVYSVLKNILNSQQKSFLIMRSLGIDGKNITIQIFVELFFTLFISFAVVFVLWLMFKLRNFGTFFSGIHNSSILVVLLIYIVSSVVFAILGFRYSVSVLSSSIVNKEME